MTSLNFVQQVSKELFYCDKSCLGLVYQSAYHGGRGSERLVSPHTMGASCDTPLSLCQVWSPKGWQAGIFF